MHTIALLNQKGGVGKTTTVANLAAALAARGLKIAAIDMDPQSHLTMHFGIEPGASTPGLYEMLTQDAAMSDASVQVQENLWVTPACIDLAGAEIELVSTVGREQLLADRLAAEDLPYDYVLIDCPPSLSLLTLNALAAADEVIIPLQPHFLALQGFGKLLETISLVQRRVNPRLRVGGVVLCMYESNTRLAGEVTQDVAGFLANQDDPNAPWAGARLYKSRIRRNVKLAECPSFGESIFNYAPGCPGAADYDALATEFCQAHAKPEPEGEPDAVSAIAEKPATPAIDQPTETSAAPVISPPAEELRVEAATEPTTPEAESPPIETHAFEATPPPSSPEAPAAPPSVNEEALTEQPSQSEPAMEPPAPETGDYRP